MPHYKMTMTMMTQASVVPQISVITTHLLTYSTTIRNDQNYHVFGQIGFGVERRGGGDQEAEEHHDGLEPARIPEHDRQHRGVHGEGDRAVANQAKQGEPSKKKIGNKIEIFLPIFFLFCINTPPKKLFFC